MFLDESRFNLSHSDGRARVYRRQNERYADCCVQERDRFGGGSVMVWAGITSRRRTNLVFVDGTLTAARYRDNILAVEVVNFLNPRSNIITIIVTTSITVVTEQATATIPTTEVI